MASTRRLIHIPIIHTDVDLGSYREQVRRLHVTRYGASAWCDHVRRVDEFWRRLRERMLALPLDHSKVKLYQDGLPACGREREIVQELAGQGSKNHQLLLELVRKGATLVGSEDPSLLLQERDRLLREGLAGGRGEVRAPAHDELLERRDRYIAATIANTLDAGEAGILFIGALHRVVEKLPSDIEVEELAGRRIRRR